jgi:hypothetical protein
MGFFGRLFGRRPSPTDELLASFNRNATLVSIPTDHKLLKEAEDRKGHLGPKAVSDEYNRMILQKHGR